ncbi:MAG: hypothetical protein AAF591_09475 [Verrucomicrobiota bacterium]
MKSISLFSVVALGGILLLGGCETPPEPDFSNLPGKFNLQKIQNDLWSVTYTGTAGMSESRAEAFAGQRVSALCLAEGYSYFIILEKNTIWQQRPGQPGAAPESIAAHEHHVPVVQGQVRFFKDEPDVATTAVFDAAQAQQNLKAFD